MECGGLRLIRVRQVLLKRSEVDGGGFSWIDVDQDGYGWMKEDGSLEEEGK